MVKKRIFENTEAAFALKSDSDLERAYFLFKMISKQPLVRIGTAVTKFALNANLPVEGLIRATVFDHFCGGVNAGDCISVVDKMFEKGVCSVLDFSVEGKEEEVLFDSALERLLGLIEFSKDKKSMPFSVFKPSGLGRFEIWERKSAGVNLSLAEQEEWGRIEGRFNRICQKAEACGIRLLIDAEESWIQGAVDELVGSMMHIYNKERPIIFNTIQCYRHDRLAYLKDLHVDSLVKGYKIGVKIVRGAYMEKERERASDKGYVSPICEDKAATDINFNTIMTYALEHINDIALYIGSHNEDSNYLAIQLMSELSLSVEDQRIWFGQLFGMSDHISYNLASNGYNVSKYLPFGPVKDVMPYLIRRAEENTSVAGQTNRELDLLKKEMKRRKI